MEKEKNNKTRKKTEPRYKMTQCRDKRSIVRALNTFSKQYKYIKCSNKEIDLSIQSMKLSYTNEEIEFSQLFQRDKDLESEIKERTEAEKKNIIYSEKQAKIDIQKTDVILEAIDDLISINRKTKIKEDIKEIVKAREYRGINPFLTKDSLSIGQIARVVDNEGFAKRLFSQIKSRVLFKNSGVYNSNSNGPIIKQRKLIKVEPISYKEIFYNQVVYIVENLWLLDFEAIEHTEEKLDEIAQEKKHKEFDSQYSDERNSSFFHPIDEEEYNDEEFSKEHRQSNMMEPLYHKVEKGIYQDEVWDDFAKIAEDYDLLVEELQSSINTHMYDIVYFGRIADTLPSIFTLFQKYPTLEEDIENYYEDIESDTRKIDKKYTFSRYYEKYSDIKFIGDILANHKIIMYVQDNLEVLRKYGFVFSLEEAHEVYEFHKTLETQLNITEYYGIPYVEKKDFENIMLFYDYDEDKMHQSIRCDLYSNPYVRKIKELEEELDRVFGKVSEVEEIEIPSFFEPTSEEKTTNIPKFNDSLDEKMNKFFDKLEEEERKEKVKKKRPNIPF